MALVYPWGGGGGGGGDLTGFLDSLHTVSYYHQIQFKSLNAIGRDIMEKGSGLVLMNSRYPIAIWYDYAQLWSNQNLISSRA